MMAQTYMSLIEFPNALQKIFLSKRVLVRFWQHMHFLFEKIQAINRESSGLFGFEIFK
jgi:hypothetical protein